MNRQLLEDLLKFKRIDGVKDVLNDVLSGFSRMRSKLRDGQRLSRKTTLESW